MHKVEGNHRMQCISTQTLIYTLKEESSQKHLLCQLEFVVTKWSLKLRWTLLHILFLSGGSYKQLPCLCLSLEIIIFSQEPWSGYYVHLLLLYLDRTYGSVKAKQVTLYISEKDWNLQCLHLCLSILDMASPCYKAHSILTMFAWPTRLLSSLDSPISHCSAKCGSLNTRDNIV